MQGEFDVMPPATLQNPVYRGFEQWWRRNETFTMCVSPSSTPASGAPTSVKTDMQRLPLMNNIAQGARSQQEQLSISGKLAHSASVTPKHGPGAGIHP